MSEGCEWPGFTGCFGGAPTLGSCRWCLRRLRLFPWVPFAASKTQVQKFIFSPCSKRLIRSVQALQPHYPGRLRVSLATSLMPLSPPGSWCSGRGQRLGCGSFPSLPSPPKPPRLSPAAAAQMCAELTRAAAPLLGTRHSRTLHRVCQGEVCHALPHPCPSFPSSFTVFHFFFLIKSAGSGSCISSSPPWRLSPAVPPWAGSRLGVPGQEPSFQAPEGLHTSDYTA